MARIPLQIAQGRLEREPGVSYPQGGGPIGAAVTEFGGSLSEVAQIFDARKERQDIFDGNLREEEGLSQFALDEQDAVANAPADGSNIVSSVYGEVDPVTGRVAKQGSFDQRFNEVAAKMPASQRQQFLAKREVYRLKGQQRLTPLQIGRRREYEEFETEKKLADFVNAIEQSDSSDPKIIADFKARGEAFIRASSMDALEKDKRVEEWNQKAEIALGMAMNREDPSQVRSLLGAPKPGEGGGDPVSNVVSKIIGVESGGSATAKNPRSSASGLGQFTDSTWLSTIRKHRPDLASSHSDRELLRMKTDPALGREMTTRLTEDNAAFLRSNNLPVTEGNIYLAHFAGEGGAKAILRERDEVRLENVLGADAMKANPHLAGRTVGWIKNWAAQKMGGAAVAGGEGPSIDPRFSSLTMEQRLALAQASDAALADQMAALRADLDVITTNAPTAIQNTGVYTGAPMPEQDDFIKAYGAENGPEKHRTFQAEVETAESIYAMQKMPADEIQSMLKVSAAAIGSGDMAALGAAKHASLAAAADATLKARTADPATYVQTAFPNVHADWAAALRAPPNSSQLAAAYQKAVASSIAAQEQLGIPLADQRVLPGAYASEIAARFSDQSEGSQNAAQLMRSLEKNFGSHWPRVFSELAASKQLPGTAIVIGAMNRPDQARAAESLAAAAKVGTQDLEKAVASKKRDVAEKVDEHLAEFAGTLENNGPSGVTTYLTFREGVYQLALSYARSEGATEAAERAYADVISRKYDIRDTYRVPVEYDADTVEENADDLVSRLTGEGIVPPVSGIDEAATRAAYLSQVKANGFFVTSPDESGLTLFDETGAAVMQTNGQPVSFTWRELLAAGTAAETVQPAGAEILGAPVPENEEIIRERERELMEQRARQGGQFR